jgi:hypothetical protein
VSTTIINSLGVTEYEDNGQQVVQVFEGNGKPDFEKLYWQALSDTHWFLKLLDEAPKTRMLVAFTEKINRLKAAIAGGYGHERAIIQAIKDLRWMIKTLIAPHNPEDDLRRCACHLENRWKADTDWRYEE